MTQVLTIVPICALSGYLLWRYSDRLFKPDGVHLTLRLDRPEPGAHLIWDIANNSVQPVTLTKLIVHGRGGATDTVPLGLPKILAPGDRLTLPTDGDWSLLGAKSIAVADSTGQEHHASRRQLVAIQRQLRQLIDRRDYNTSARAFLAGAADLAFGVVILGLGFFMLMWVIATG
jgi:hypothetical protein